MPWDRDEHSHAASICAPQALRRAIGEYMAHYHEARNHQVLRNRLIRPEPICSELCIDPAPSTIRWNAQLLLPRSGMKLPTEFLDTARALQLARMLASLMTFAHFSVSLLICFTNSCGVLAITSTPRAARGSRTSGEPSAFVISRCSS
jgi:hypothetical protein